MSEETKNTEEAKENQNASKQSTAKARDGKKSYKVEFLKPVAGFGYFPGDKATIKITEKKYAALEKGGFVKSVK